MPLNTVCNRHRRLVPTGERCPLCKAEAAERGKPRRQANHERLGRKSKHWRELSFRLISRHRRQLGPVCLECGVREDPSDPGSKLTLDLIRGGDHATAREDECRVLCRRCHGKAQGGRGRLEDGEARTSPLAAPLARIRTPGL